MSPILLRIHQLILLVLIQAVILFGCAGIRDWPAAWWYLGLYVLMLVAASLVIIPRRRDVTEERSKGTAGLDTTFAFMAQVIGRDLIHCRIFSRAMGHVCESIFPQVVRIQVERDHRGMVISLGMICKQQGELVEISVDG